MKKNQIKIMINNLKSILNSTITVTNQKEFLDSNQIPSGKKVYNVEGSIMFVDIRNSTIMNDIIGRKNMVKVYKMYTHICKTAVEFYRGKILQIVGDGILCAFTSDKEMLSGFKAVSAAITIHTYIEQAMNVQLDDELKIGCGIGIRTGHVFVTRLLVGKSDQVAYPSDITNYASKLCGEASARCILFDDKSLEHLSKELKNITKKYATDWGKFNLLEEIVWKIE